MVTLRPLAGLFIGIGDYAVAGIGSLVTGLVVVATVIIISLIVDDEGLGRGGQGAHHRAHGQTGGRPGGHRTPTGTTIVRSPAGTAVDIDVSIVVDVSIVIVVMPVMVRMWARPRMRARMRAGSRTRAWFRVSASLAPETAAAKAIAMAETTPVEAAAAMRTAAATAPGLNFLGDDGKAHH